ncbi:MAG: glycosyl hydrolase family 18 protein [Draconibacterium sp.]
MKPIRALCEAFILLIITLFSFLKLSAQTNQFRIIGYVPNWIDVNTFALDFDYTKVTHLNFAFQNPDANGNLYESNSGLTTLVTKAHQHNVKVLVSIGGGSAAGDPVKTNYQNQIKTSEKRAAFISKILAYLVKYKLDGLDVDEEGPAINANYGAFIKQLADSLKPKGYLLTAAVGWGAENIPNSAFQYFDFINLMSYDLTGSWDMNNPGQHSPYWYAEKMIADYKKRGVKKEQICLGVPFYGYGFYKKSGYQAYNDILINYPDAWNKDQVGDTIFYNGINTIKIKTELAFTEAAGIMIWELSLDTKGEKSLLNVISGTADSMKIIGLSGSLKQPLKIKIYPNPANNTLYIESIQAFQNPLIRIFSINGSLLKTNTFVLTQQTITKIDISGLENGIYVCSVADKNGEFTGHFLKKQH